MNWPWRRKRRLPTRGATHILTSFGPLPIDAKALSKSIAIGVDATAPATGCIGIALTKKETTMTPEQIKMLAEAQRDNPELDLLKDFDGAKLKMLLLENDSMVCRYGIPMGWSEPVDRLYSEKHANNGMSGVTVTDVGREWLRINGGEWIEAGGKACSVKVRYDAAEDRTEMVCTGIDAKFRNNRMNDGKYRASNGWLVGSAAVPQLESDVIWLRGNDLDADDRTVYRLGNHVAAIVQAVNEANAAWEKELVEAEKPKFATVPVEVKFKMNGPDQTILGHMVEIALHLRDLEKLLRQKMTPARYCPKCGESVDYEPAHEAEPENNVGAWNGGYACQCGWEDENDPPEVPDRSDD